MNPPKISLWRFIAYLVLLQIADLSFAKGLKFVFKTFQLNEDYSWILVQVLASIFAIVVTIYINQYLQKNDLKQSFLFLGFGRPSFKPLFIGFAVALFNFFVCVIIPYGVDFKLNPKPHWPLLLLWMIVGPGLNEQVLIQGFIFRNFRNRMSFVRAAVFSGIIFALVHSYYLFQGLTLANLSSFLQFGIDSLIIAVPFALLFERGNNVFWGIGIAHLGIDVIWSAFNLVPMTKNHIVPGYMTWRIGILEPWQVGAIFSVSCTAMFMFLLTKWMLPQRGPKQ